MPYVIPADVEKYSIYKTIESKAKLPVAYRARQCDMLSAPELTSLTWRLSVKTSSQAKLCLLHDIRLRPHCRSHEEDIVLL